MRVPSGLNATLVTRPVVPLESSRASRPRIPHLRRPVETAGDDPRAVRAERHAQQHRIDVCPFSSSRGVPVRASHTFAVWSPLPVTMRVPSGLNATLITPARVPLESSRAVPVRASHTFAVRSPLPVTIRVPSGLNATLITAPVCPFELEQGRARPRVPHLRRPVIAAGDDARAVRAERHAAHRARVPFELEQGRPRSARPRPSPSGPDCR